LHHQSGQAAFVETENPVATESETAVLHPEAIDHLPPFITLPGETDWFLVGMGFFLIATVVGIGVFYLKLHALPEHMAHRGQKVQFEIVAVLALIALFTHNHAFWIAGLLLAMVPIPDFTTPLKSMAHSLGRMAGPPASPPDRRDEAET
jgi:uncharacterized membrane protein